MFVRSVVTLVLIILAGYGAIKAWPVLSGPDLDISSPRVQASIPDGFVTIAGTAKRTETLTLDGGPFLMDENGAFSRTLLLPKGGAILTLTATDRFGRQKTERRTVFVP